MTGFDAELVVATSHVLDERVALDDHCRGVVGLQAAHRPQPCSQPSVIALDPIVRILDRVVQRVRQQVVDDVRQGRSAVGDDLFRLAMTAIAVVKNVRAAAISRRCET